MMMVLFSAALLVSLATTPALLPVLRMAGVMDLPNARSSHVVATPRGGGVSVVAAVLAALALGAVRGYPASTWVIGGLFAFAAIGLADDVAGLKVPVRLALQFVIATTVSIGLLGMSVQMAMLTVPTVILGSVWLVAYTNAFNFMDGVNGISAFNAILAGGWFHGVGLSRHVDVVAGLGAAVAGSAIGFLPWNSPKARVFLGDVGSYALGFAIGCLALTVWLTGAPMLTAVAPLLVYVADTGFTLARRVIAGRTWKEAHREHVYQILTDAGWSQLAVAATVTGFAGLICLVVAMGGASPGLLELTAISLVLTSYLLTPLCARRLSRVALAASP